MAWYYYALIVFPAIYLARKYFNGPKTNLKGENLKDKIIVITGSSAGIGKESALELLRKGAKVILACRSEEKTKNIINSIKDENQRKNAFYINLNLNSLKSVEKFENDFSKKFEKIDFLITNAGLINDTYKKTEDNIEEVFQVNYLTHLLFVMKLTKYLTDYSRVIHVSSEAHQFVKSIDFDGLEGDMDFKDEKLHSRGNFLTYAFSKISNIYFSNTLALYFEKLNINAKSVSVHPGAVSTEIVRPTTIFTKVISWLIVPIIWIFFKDSFVGAQTTLHVCYEKFENLINGGYYQNCKISKISELTKSDEMRKRLMKYSVELIQRRLKIEDQDLKKILNI